MSDLDSGSWVISTNPLHAGNGVGIVQQVRGDQAKVEFHPSVFSAAPYLTETRILNLKELQVVKSPLERLRDKEFQETWRFDLRTRAAQLLFYNRDGQLSDARTDLLPHQISVANKVVSSPRRCYLIADEVGLGKTIEAGMILYALRQRGQARRVLIIPPAGLTLQWQEEMEEKFGLKFAVYREDVDGPLAFDRMDHLIASVDTLKLDKPLKNGRREGHKTMLLGSRDWDVIIFDEAHKLSARTWSAQKTDKTLNYRLAEDLQDRCRSLILLTATPHQGEETKFQNLLSLLHEHIIFDDWAEVPETAVLFTDLVLRNRKSKVTDADGQLIFKGMDVHPVKVSLLDGGEKKFHKALETYLREGYGFADEDPLDKQHKAIGFVMTTFQKLAASSTRAIKRALGKRQANLRKDQEKAAEKIKEVYDERHAGEYEAQQAEKVEVSFAEAEIGMLENLLEMELAEDGKQGELFRVIDSVSRGQPGQLVLIFTEYLATQDFIIELLEERYGEDCTAIIRGGMTLWEKKKSIEAFRDNPRVRFLVSTEAGGEGINLQFAHLMINYDLPWNPFRLAQRYGRLYRYGQERRVQVFNFQNAGTIEDKVREYLERKTKTAAKRLTGVTGETEQEIEEGLLGLFEEMLDYEKIYRDGLAKGNIKPSQKEIDAGLKRAEKAYETAYASLFSKDIAPFNPDRFKHEIESPLTLKDVEAFVGEFVKREGRNFSKQDDGTWEFLLPQCFKAEKGLKKRYGKVTFDRKEAIRHSEYEFMAMGHALTDAAVQRCGTVDFGGMATCRSVRAPKLAGVKGLLCNFSVKIMQNTPEGENTFFELESVFVDGEGNVNDEAAEVCLEAPARADEAIDMVTGVDVEKLYKKAFETALDRHAEQNVWDEAVICLNAALVVFGD